MIDVSNTAGWIPPDKQYWNDPLYANYACSPCVTAFNQRRSPCTDNVCVQHFDVDTVLGLVTRSLESAD